MRIGAMLGDISRSLFKRPVTERYPFERKPTPERLRGQLTFDAAKCTGCKICVRDCPAVRDRAARRGQGDQALRDEVPHRPLHLLRAVRRELQLRRARHVARAVGTGGARPASRSRCCSAGRRTSRRCKNPPPKPAPRSRRRRPRRRPPADRREPAAEAVEPARHVATLPFPTPRPARVAVLGVGNEMNGDDGAGVRVVRALAARLAATPGLLLIDGGRGPRELHRAAPPLPARPDRRNRCRPPGPAARYARPGSTGARPTA